MTATLDRPTRGGSRAAEAKPGGPGARFRGRWRVALRYGARDARRNKGRTALIAIMVALPVALGSFAATVLWSTQETPERMAARELGPDLVASVTFTNLPGLQQAPDLSMTSQSGEALPGPVTPDDVAATLAATLPAGSQATMGLTAPVIAYGTDLLTYAPATQVDLTVPAVAAAFPLADGALPGPGEVALTRSIANDLHLSVGDPVSARLNAGSGVGTGTGEGQTELGSATVSGILAADQPAGTSVLYPGTGPLVAPADLTTTDSGRDIQPRWFISGDSPVTWDDVVALNESSFLVTSRAVLLDPPPDSAVPLFATTPSSSSSSSDFLMTWGVFGAVIVVALLEAVLLIGPAFAVSARRSSRALAIIAANGGTARSLRAIVLGTAVVIGTVASLAGAALAVGAAAILMAVDGTLRFLSPPWPILGGIALVGLLIAAAGAWLPARGASKADVVAVLAGRRGEVTARRWPAVVGTVLAVGGFAAAILGGLTTQPMLIMGGVVAGEIGLVLACGGIVAGLGRLAGALPLSWRFALRDAARNRSRTSPAIAAVLVATAGATAGLVYSTAQSQHDYFSQALIAAPGVVMLSSGSEPLTDDDVDAVTAIVHDAVPRIGDLLPVTVARPPAEHDGLSTSVTLRQPAGRGWSVSGNSIWGPVVGDDDRLVDLLGIPDPDAARTALADGRVVTLAGLTDSNGTATFDVETWQRDGDDGQLLEATTISVPGTGVGNHRGPSNTSLPLVPAALVDDLGMHTELGGLISAGAVHLTTAEQQTLQARLDDQFGQDEWDMSKVSVSVGEDVVDYGAPDWLATLLIAGAGGVLALAAAWIAAALAATESRPDLATLTAVGATPSTRKRIVAAQAGTIVAVGALVGVLSGYPLGAAFVLFERHRWGNPDLAWSLTFPWPWLLALLVGLPLLAVTAAWLATRSRLVLTRRVDG